MTQMARKVHRRSDSQREMWYKKLTILKRASESGRAISEEVSKQPYLYV